MNRLLTLVTFTSLFTMCAAMIIGGLLLTIAYHPMFLILVVAGVELTLVCAILALTILHSSDILFYQSKL